MNSLDTSGRSLVDFWDRAVEQGMNEHTARAVKAACSQILAIEDSWESLDIQKVDVDDLCRRFEIKRNKDFTPRSLDTYKRRFAKAVELFLAHGKDPARWKAASRSALSERKLTNGTDRNQQRADESQFATPLTSGLVDFPFPLRQGVVVHLRLPIDLKRAEVKRINAYLTTLATHTPDE